MTDTGRQGWAMRFFAVGVEPVGFIAIGQFATGVIAIGQVAIGVVAVGQLARGVITVGQLSVGLVAVGQLALAPVRAIGMLALGGRTTALLGARFAPIRSDPPGQKALRLVGLAAVTAIAWFIVGPALIDAMRDVFDPVPTRCVGPC